LPSKRAWQHAARYSKRPRPCRRHVSRTLRIRSTNQLPRLLSMLPLPFRHRTASRNAGLAALFVGSTPSFQTKAHSFASLAIKFRHVAAVLGQRELSGKGTALIHAVPFPLASASRLVALRMLLNPAL
jgi:hypothetical protein